MLSDYAALEKEGKKENLQEKWGNAHGIVKEKKK